MHTFRPARVALAAAIVSTAILTMPACSPAQSVDGSPDVAQPAADEIPPPSPRPLKPFPISQGQPIPLQRTEPEDGSTVTETPHALQMWFLIGDYDTEHSWIELHGPKGRKELGPLQLVGKRSLVAEVREALPDGDYVSEWWAADDDGHGFKGTTKFTVKRTP